MVEALALESRAMEVEPSFFCQRATAGMSLVGFSGDERFPLAQLTIYLAIDASRHEKWNGEENRLQLNN
jgi:hypothetical protein